MIEKLAKFFSAAGVLFTGIYDATYTVLKNKGSIIEREPEKEVIILGNGPSFNDIDIEKVRESGMDIVCVNFFPAKNEKFFEMRPQYLCLFDPIFYEESSAQERVDELFRILERVDWKLKILCFAGREPKINNSNIEYVKIAYPVLSSEYMTGLLYRLYDKNRICLGAQNVVIAAGSYFVEKRVKHIYYAGIDMSEFKGLYVDEECRIYVDYTHSYGSERLYSNVVKKGEFYKLLGMYQRMFLEFHHLRKYADRCGVSFTNLSDESYVDVFPKDTKLFHKFKE